MKPLPNEIRDLLRCKYKGSYFIMHMHPPLGEASFPVGIVCMGFPYVDCQGGDVQVRVLLLHLNASSQIEHVYTIQLYSGFL